MSDTTFGKIWHKVSHTAHTAHTIHFLHGLRLLKAKSILLALGALGTALADPLGCAPAPGPEVAHHAVSEGHGGGFDPETLGLYLLVGVVWAVARRSGAVRASWPATAWGVTREVLGWSIEIFSHFKGPDAVRPRAWVVLAAWLLIGGLLMGVAP